MFHCIYIQLFDDPNEGLEKLIRINQCLFLFVFVLLLSLVHVMNLL